MFTKVQVFQGDNPNVWKYVFEKEDVCVEAVLYKYESFEKRTVMCVSVQSGCPVGCVFCGTGRNFIRNLTAEEIQYQVDYIVEQVEMELNPMGKLGENVSLNARCEKFQIMFMSMGEPMLNWNNVECAIVELADKYRNAQLLLSTMGVNDDDVFRRICIASRHIEKLGLQFSLHSAIDSERNQIIPFKNKMEIRKLRDAGTVWNRYTKRPVYLNICVDKTNLQKEEVNRIMDLFSPMVFSLTFSVICEYENGKVKSLRDKRIVEERTAEIMQQFLAQGYNVRKFDPAGQDDIGAGCGQLWYVQEWMKERKNGCKSSI